MKIAIISDIHANLEALYAVLRDIRTQRVNKLFCLGDTIGYGPYPVECLKTVRKICEVVLCGNHEDAVLRPEEHESHMSKFAWRSVQFNQRRLKGKDLLYLATLPYTDVQTDLQICLTHSSFIEPETWKYLDTPELIRSELSKIPVQICFSGHTHIPYIFGSAVGHYKNLKHDTLELADDEKYFINVGSVGQPRNGDCRASYGILDVTSENKIFRLRRVFYDIQKTHRMMQRFGISDFLSERLYLGE